MFTSSPKSGMFEKLEKMGYDVTISRSNIANCDIRISVHRKGDEFCRVSYISIVDVINGDYMYLQDAIIDEVHKMYKEE